MSRRNSDSGSSSSQTKVQELDTFDGSDLKKLCTFLIQCMVLQWFEPDLLSDSDPDDCPLWMDDWKEFVIELQTTFGPHDLVADAKHELDCLQMKDNQCINNKQANSRNDSTQDSGQNKSTSDKTQKASSNNLSAPDLSNKLGKDSKLTAAEHKRCFNLNLCMFCGGNSHFLDKCPKKEAKANAHAAMAAESTPAAQSDSGPAPKSKN
ncbi:hypothetical protein ID866_11061 [Astraeus odoratus]|nr:hypothetical protein ID866_11061 [Astraeus odoratus]